MKIKPKIYAKFLYEKLKAADSREAKEIIKAFVELLFSHNNLSKSNQIIKEFEKYYCTAEGVVEAKISSVRKLSSTEITNFKKAILNHCQNQRREVARIDVLNELDNAILGGAVVEVDNWLYDGSLKRQLIAFKEQIIKNKI